MASKKTISNGAYPVPQDMANCVKLDMKDCCTIKGDLKSKPSNCDGGLKKGK